MPGLWITGRSAVDKGCLLGRVRSRSACHKRRFPASVGHRTSTLPHMGVFSSRLLGLPDHPHSSHWLIVDKGLVPIPHIPSGTPGEIQILAESEVSAVLSPPSTALLRLRMSLKMGRGERDDGKKRTPVWIPTGVPTMHRHQPLGQTQPLNCMALTTRSMATM